MDALRARPEIASAGRGYYLPLDVAYRLPFTIVGAAPVTAGTAPTAQFHSVDDSYFGVLRTSLLRGRPFGRSDDAGAVPVVVVNETFAKQHFPTGDAIGKRIVSDVRNMGPLGQRIARGDEHEIVGVVRDVKNTSLREAAEPAIYFSARQFPYRTMNVVMRARGPESQLADVLREEVRRLDRGLAVGEVQPLERVLASTIDPPRLIRMLLAVFAALALTLAAVGIYGVLTFTVTERRREMSVRIALGAEPRGVLWMVVRQGVVLTLVGFAFGIVGAGVAGQSIAVFLYEVTAWDPITIGGVLGVLLFVAGTACLAPAWRASRENPVRALRAD
jgi:predicted permease